MNGALPSIALALLLMISPACSRASLPSFFQQLFLEVEPSYAKLRASEFETFCASYGLDSLSADNRRIFLAVHFFHDLFTCSSASNCSRGGILQIPYFWHWVDPNPRHSIILLPDSTELVDVRPPAPYTRYRTFADIDRVPALYFADLITETPKYSHLQCGSFFTFGWCSEREMSFIALMTSIGYRGKIQQQGIHMYSVLWCEFDARNGEKKVLAANVDNTFDSISWHAVSNNATLDGWLRDIGSGTEIGWYNRVARSEEQREKLRAMPVSDATRQRILEQVREALNDPGRQQ